MKKARIISVFVIVIAVVAALYFATTGLEPKTTTEDVSQEQSSTEVAEAPMEPGTTIETESGKWTLVWNDEFEGDALDTTKWDYQYGTGSEYGLSGWGNEEQQYYQAENVSVSDGILKIEARKENVGNQPYTSGRIRTVNNETSEPLFEKTYGKFEARMKLPTGNGVWPAFWLLPDLTDNPYGTWAVSGEIDIMEAKGRLPQESSGTIHYGQVWPNNKYSGGTYNMPEGESIDQYHVYSLEWEPGEMRWYVDGNMFHKETSWYARGEGKKEDYPFPAPFDKDFYILLNLAIGGNFDGGRLPSNSDLPATMEIDYVRVYDKEGGYDKTVKKPRVEVDEVGTEKYISEDLEYNYVQDTAFETVNAEAITNRVMDVNSSNWYFLACAEYGGRAELTTGEEDGYSYVSVDVTNKGTQNYSVQLIQHLPMVKGYTYELSFDAKSDESRGLLTKFGGDDDNGWATYAGAFSDKLTPEWQHYTQKFQMMSATDGTTRLEINLGETTGELKIANITLKVVEE